MMPEQQNKMLAGKCALVTGGARRIGAEIVRALHACGAAVAIHYRSSADEAAALANELNEDKKGNAECFKADLCDMEQLVPLIEAVSAWRGLDILVNNASSFYPTPVGTITEQQWHDLVGSNLKAPLFLSQAARPELERRRGTIVNIVDIHARRPLRDHPVYGAAKAGLIMLTQSLAKDLAPDIRVNAIAPGAILWPEDGMTDETRRSIVSQIPLGRAGLPGDIARTAMFLVADAPYITGQVIAVDGGRSIGW